VTSPVHSVSAEPLSGEAWGEASSTTSSSEVHSLNEWEPGVAEENPVKIVLNALRDQIMDDEQEEKKWSDITDMLLIRLCSPSFPDL